MNRRQPDLDGCLSPRVAQILAVFFFPSCLPRMTSRWTTSQGPGAGAHIPTYFLIIFHLKCRSHQICCHNLSILYFSIGRLTLLLNKCLV